MGAFAVLPIACCLTLAVGTLVLPLRWLRRYAEIVASEVVLVSGFALVAAVLAERTPTALNGQLRADALSAFMLIVVGSVGLTATWGGLPVRSAPEPEP